MSYAALSDLRAWLSVSDSANDADLQRALDAATQWIDAYTGRHFALDTADQTRVYYPSDTGEVDVTDLVTVTSVKIDTNGDRTYATTLATTDYELLPLAGPRYERIRIWPTSSRSFSMGRLVQVVGKFGYVENGQTPAAIRQACLIEAARLYERRTSPFGVLTNVEVGRFETLRASDPDVQALLDPYKVESGPTAAAGSWVMV